MIHTRSLIYRDIACQQNLDPSRNGGYCLDMHETPPPKTGLGARLKHAREAANMTLDEVACQMGYKSRQAVGHWETEHSVPSADVLRRLCELYKISSDCLLWDVVPIFAKRSHNESSDLRGPWSRLGTDLDERVQQLTDKEMAKLKRLVIAHLQNAMDDPDTDAQEYGNDVRLPHQRKASGI